MPPFGNKSPNQQPEKEFTPLTISLGQEFLKRRREFSGSFSEKTNKAANALGYTNGYGDIPSEVRSWIATEDAKRRKERASEAEIIEKENFKARMDAHIAQMGEDWNEQMQNNPDFRHAMTHPEDGAIPPSGLK